MYSYRFDAETGGLLLHSSPTQFSKEPRPVYAGEMDILHFDQYWAYEKQNEVPYLWAESNVYWYRGVQLAKLKGGDLFHAPELLPVTDEEGSILFSKASGEKLLPIDLKAMCARNRDLMAVVEDATVKRIVKEYEKFMGKLDIFHVAFSGGKDSAVLLDLVKKALPHDSFVVIFGDTGMEFPDTYEVVKVTQKKCQEEGIPFYTAQSHFTPTESWKLFGPPSKTLRWCCSVHKSTPQTLKLREIVGKDNFTGMDFLGVRKHESLARSTYEYENYGKKLKGQYSFNPILEWTSAEVWLYIYLNNLFINKAYTKGNMRAGCLLCPMSGGNSDYIRRCNYTEDVDRLIRMVQVSNAWDSHSEADLQSYVTSGGWLNRRSGRGIKDNAIRCKETANNGKIIFELINPTSDWHEWIKTTNSELFQYTAESTATGWRIIADESAFKKAPTEGRYFRQSMRKAAYCVGCRVCESNCKGGHLKFEDGKLSIDNCIQCHECHEIPAGCHVYNSLKMPQDEKKMKTVNCFDDHAPKRDWLVSFFDLKDDFFTEHTLGPNMFTHFKRFLRDGGLISGNKCTDFAKMISDIGWETETALGLMMINLVYENAQFEWYVERMDIDHFYSISDLKEALLAIDMKEKAANSVVKSFKRIVETPLGQILNFGYVTDEDDLVRTKCFIGDPKVFLYALYKFMEKCNLDKEFHVSYLYDESIERDGVSPVRLFGLSDEEELKSLLLGLSARYPEFINATFTNDLKTITLYDKTSQEVLDLFREDM